MGGAFRTFMGIRHARAEDADANQADGGRHVRAAVVADGLLWLLVVVPAEVWTLTGEEPPLTRIAMGGAVAVAAAAIVAMLRRRPLGGVVIAAAAASWSIWFGVLVPIAAYLTGRNSPSLRPSILVCCGAVAAAAAALAVTRQPLDTWMLLVAALLFSVLLPWLIGLYARATARLSAAGWEQARRLERERHLVAEQARMRERSRIAQDMHDYLGHDLSLIALRAAALERAPDLHETHREQAKRVRTAAAEGTERLREIIGVMRADAASVSDRPHDESVLALVERARASGLDVAFETGGAAQGEAAPLPPLADRAVHRVVQEALTNATKHAPGTAVDVRVVHEPDAVQVTVGNALPSPRAEKPDDQDVGSGLIGLRERVHVVGGRFDAGRRDGRWIVRARIPTDVSALSAADDRTAEDRGPEPTVDVRAHREAKRWAGRGIAVVLGLPVAAAAVGYLLVIALTAYQAATATLDPDAFSRIRVGQDRAAARALLPPRELFTATEDVAGRGAAVRAAECHYYRADSDVFGTDGTRYRVCFGGDAVLAKNVVRR